MEKIGVLDIRPRGQGHLARRQCHGLPLLLHRKHPLIIVIAAESSLLDCVGLEGIVLAIGANELVFVDFIIILLSTDIVTSAELIVY